MHKPLSLQSLVLHSTNANGCASPRSVLHGADGDLPSIGGMQWHDDRSDLGQLGTGLRIGAVEASLWPAGCCVMVDCGQIVPA